MDTDPNPFRDSPDAERSASSTEAPDDQDRDVNAAESATSGTNPSPMSEQSADRATAPTGTTTSVTGPPPAESPTVESSSGAESASRPL